MEHNHETGKFRNICCRKCNARKSDKKMRSDNTSGYRYIYKNKRSSCKQGFRWRFAVMIDGKNKVIKSCVDLEKLIKIRDEWFKHNPGFHT